MRVTIGPTKEAAMLAIWVKVRVKPDQRKRFLEAIEIDALRSEKDEPGCLRFNVLQDDQDENVYYFYEVYKDQAALEAHRAAPHYQIWRAAADTLDGPTAPTRCKPVFPADRPYWGKM
jgi:autoinducer 2-degrading protein